MSPGQGGSADEPALPPLAAIERAQALLDAGQPFGAHEVFEAVWKVAVELERDLWRGLAQVAVGITHARRGNPVGAKSLLTRGVDSLSVYAGTTPYGLDVKGIKDWAEAASHELDRIDDPLTLLDQQTKVD